MTRHCVTDEQYGILTRRLDELKRRVDEGTVPFDYAFNGLQSIIERRVPLIIGAPIINLDAAPYIPDGWQVEVHRKRGSWEFNPNKIILHEDQEQQNGKLIFGHQLRKRLIGLKTFNANLLDWLLKNPDFIPKSWKAKNICFWGTIYRDSDGCLCVRCLAWDGRYWCWLLPSLDNKFSCNSVAALLCN